MENEVAVQGASTNRITRQSGRNVANDSRKCSKFQKLCSSNENRLRGKVAESKGDRSKSRFIHRARVRLYDPVTGRFLNQDPMGIAGGLNLYRYADSNPLLLTDPKGLDCDAIDAGKAADFAAIAAIVALAYKIGQYLIPYFVDVFKKSGNGNNNNNENDNYDMTDDDNSTLNVDTIISDFSSGDYTDLGGPDLDLPAIYGQGDSDAYYSNTYGSSSDVDIASSSDGSDDAGSDAGSN